MRRFIVLVFLSFTVCVVLAGPVSAITSCADGTTSGSAGGSGTCSWHGGIADDDYSYSPDGGGGRAARARAAQARSSLGSSWSASSDGSSRTATSSNRRGVLHSERMGKT